MFKSRNPMYTDSETQTTKLLPWMEQVAVAKSHLNPDYLIYITFFLTTKVYNFMGPLAHYN